MFGEFANKITGVLLESPHVETSRLAVDEIYLREIATAVYNDLRQQILI